MDDDDLFEDALFDDDLLEHSSQESLTNAAQSYWTIAEAPREQLGGLEISLDHAIREASSPGISSGEQATEVFEALQPDAVAGNHAAFPYETRRATSLLSPLDFSGTTSRDEMIAKIECCFEKIVDALLGNEDKLTIALRTSSLVIDRASESYRSRKKYAGDIETVDISFPGSTAQEAWRFSVIVRILELVHEALVHDIVITKRDIYYKDPALSGHQGIVDGYVDDVARTFNVSRQSLNVGATAKGLFAGAISVNRNDGTTMDGALDSKGTLIPSLKDVQSIRSDATHWVLIVEKEATFRSLVERRIWEAFGTRGLIVTAKGYPDISTRAFIRSIVTASAENSFRDIPAYALMDFDPDGIGIMSTYKYGSLTLAHENEALNVSNLVWLGLRSRDITCDDNPHSSQGLLRLTPRDRRKASKMLEWDILSEGGAEAEWRQQLQTMLMLNIKAEIQLLDARAEGLVGWLKENLCVR